MALAYILGRATAGLFRALSGKPKARVSPASPARPPRVAWRDARTESLALRQAVEAMEGHVDVLQQIADAWLLSANLKQFDAQRFYANVARSRNMAAALDDDCAAVVAEIRALERQRDQAAWFEARERQAHAVADRAMMLRAEMDVRLRALAATRGVIASDLVAQAAATVRPVSQTALDPLLREPADDHPIVLTEWLR